MHSIKTKLFFVFFLVICVLQLQAQTLIQTAHLDHLYSDKIINGTAFGIIGIYAEYPDYKIVEDADEGVACVDDAARAAVFYLQHYRLTGAEESLRKMKQLDRFLLFMRAPNGYFYNFIFSNNTVNTTFRTSLPEANWWAWRAFFALAETYSAVKITDAGLADSMASAMNQLIEKVAPLYNREKSYKNIQGFSVPAWLPWEHGADQAAVLVKALTRYFVISRDPRAMMLIQTMCEGIMKMQLTDSGSPYCGAFLSWENIWHGWGNNQADALLDAYDVTRDARYLEAAVSEVENFYPRMIKEKYFSEMSFHKDGSSEKIISSRKDGQIAYIIRPMILASLHLYKITGKSEYRGTALKLAGWYFGKNIAGKVMYDKKTGRTLDGINSRRSVNKNSGAESTIETLLALVAIEQDAKAKLELHRLYFKK